MKADTEGGTGPFPKIGLAFSGGGYRAAAFHLGAMDCLNDVGLLQNVRALSTVSGGTFTGVAYTLALKDGKGFTQFKEEFRRWLLQTELVKQALQNLADGPPQPPEGPWTVIRACAKLYDQHLTGGKTFDAVWEGRPIHLEDICFNSTEFRTGNSFRFRYCLNGGHTIGNRNVPIQPENARQIRLADIIASSSCFPGGFEPLGFPYDFGWPDTPEGRAARDALFKQFPQALPLMDGGVFDNQGIDSLVPLSHDEQMKYSLFIFSDVYQRSPDLFALDDWPYHSPNQGPINYSSGSKLLRLFSELSLNQVNLLSWTGTIASVLAALGSFWAAWQGWGKHAEAPACLFAGLVTTGLAAALGLSRHAFKHYFQQVPQVRSQTWGLLKNLTVGQVEFLIQRRVRSLFALTSDIFMKRVRSLVYERVYDDPDLAGHRLASLVYDLAGNQTKEEQAHAEAKAQQHLRQLGSEAQAHVAYPDWLKPSEKMRAVANVGAKMKTTLWFDYPGQLDCLVLSGRMTLAWKFLRFLIRRYDAGGNAATPEITALFEKLKVVYDDCRSKCETIPLPPE